MIKNSVGLTEKILVFLILQLWFAASAYAGAVVKDPCAGKNSLLTLVSVSSCSAKEGMILLELGVQSDMLKVGGIKSKIISYPDSEIRIGIPGNNEIKLVLPNYNIQSYAGGGMPSMSGYDDFGIGFKHEFGYTENTIYAAEITVTFPSGNGGFQNYGTDMTGKGILTYSPTKALSVELIPGISSFTRLSDNGHISRFFGFNPDVVATYQFKDALQAYGEVQRNPQQGVALSGNYWFDCGLQYLLTQNIELQSEYGIFLDPPEGGYGRYIELETEMMF